jgi:hypothetical protein
MTGGNEIDFETNVIEVFKTDIRHVYQASQIQEKIEEIFPYYQINFDLDDCDRIMRIKSSKIVDIWEIIHLGRTCNLNISVLED